MCFAILTAHTAFREERMNVIVEALEKGGIFLFNLHGDGSPHRAVRFLSQKGSEEKMFH